MKVNERRTVVGGLIGHCVSPPEPWIEIDAHANRAILHTVVSCIFVNCSAEHKGKQANKHSTLLAPTVWQYRRSS